MNICKNCLYHTEKESGCQCLACYITEHNLNCENRLKATCGNYFDKRASSYGKTQPA